jgi:hypothetical protein
MHLDSSLQLIANYFFYMDIQPTSIDYLSNSLALIHMFKTSKI